MTTARTALFRCDASVKIGAGHVARCLTLARTLADRGWRCRFAVGAETPASMPAVSGWDHFVMTADATGEMAEIARHCADGFDLLVVDHYGRDARFETACRTNARTVLAIDDMADRPHDCDLLLDQTLGRRAEDYRSLVPGNCRVLAGPAYALVGGAFAERRDAALARRRDASALRRVLVSLGRMDGRRMIPAVLDALAASGLDVAVDVAVSSEAPAIEGIRRRAAGTAGLVTLHEDAEDMAELMARADLMIGTPGSTSWERCCVGLPSLLLLVADNQSLIGRSLEEAGAAVVLEARDGEVPAAALADALRTFADGDRLQRMADSAAAICDGRGAARVADAIEDRARSTRLRAAG